MIVTKGINVVSLLKWSGPHIIWLVALMSGVAAMYYFEIIRFEISWLPVSVVGTAVAIYVDFKNNQAYDRMWKARKIWGRNINDSRTWGMMIDLLEMLGETDLPAPIEAKNGILM